MATPTPPAENNENTYTIQVYVEVEVGEDPEPTGSYWEDIATVELPPRARRTTALTKAFQDNPDLTPTDKGRKYRILDAESGKVLTVKAKPPTVPDLDIT
jgi:hypothetical protein